MWKREWETKTYEDYRLEGSCKSHKTIIYYDGIIIDDIIVDGKKGSITQELFFNIRGELIELHKYARSGRLKGVETYKYDWGKLIEKKIYNGDGSLSFRDTYKYDDKRNIIEIVNYNSDGCFASKIAFTYKYDDKGNQIEYNEYNKDASLGRREAHKYDDNGNMIEEILDSRYEAGGSFKRYTYKYDSGGNKIEEEQFDSEGILNYRYTYKYNNGGKKVETKELFPDPTVALQEVKNAKTQKTEMRWIEIPMSWGNSRSTYKYDNNGNEIEYNEYQENGEIMTRHTYKYDDNGNMIEEEKTINYTLDPRTERNTHKYDDNGNMIEDTEYDSSENLRKRLTYKYDDKGNIIKKKEFKRGASLKNIWAYGYDSKGNKIYESFIRRRGKPPLSKPQWLYRYEIEYFE